MGRKCKLTPELTANLVQALQLGTPRALACQYAGIHVSQFYRWIAAGEKEESGKYRVFCDAIKEAEGQMTVNLLGRIQKAAKEGRWQAAAWILERRFPEEFARRAEQHHSLRGGEEKASARDLDAVMKALGLTKEES